MSSVVLQDCKPLEEPELKQLPVLENMGSFTDLRDGTVYTSVKINDQIWLAESMQYAIAGSVCPNNDSNNCKTLGRLYSAQEAKDACPLGYRLPTDKEWYDLWTSLDGSTSVPEFFVLYKYGFDRSFKISNAGYYNLKDNQFYSVNSLFYAWSSTLANELNAYVYSINNLESTLFVRKLRGGLTNKFSCLCIKN